MQLSAAAMLLLCAKSTSAYYGHLALFEQELLICGVDPELYVTSLRQYLVELDVSGVDLLEDRCPLQPLMLGGEY